jgi:hypothetical protein
VRHFFIALLPLSLAAMPSGGQSLAQRVTSADGIVQVTYPSRTSACGDGERYISNVFGRDQQYAGDIVWSEQNNQWNRPCVHGPARVVATVVSGEVTRLRAYVGPVPAAVADVRAVSVDSRDASAWLGEIVRTGSARVASEAMLPLVLADAPDPWPLLLAVARDDDRPRDVRRNALTWLSNGVNERLGIADAGRSASDDDQMREQAVFTLTQRPKSESVPQLIDLARGAKNPAARKAAIFWLGQSGDPRAISVYAELLGLK